MFIHTTTQRQSNGCCFLEIWWGCGGTFIMLSAQLHPQFCELQWLLAYICTELVQNSWMHQLDWGTGVKMVHNILSCITPSSSWVAKPFSLPRNWWLNQIYQIWLGIWMFNCFWVLFFVCLNTKVQPICLLPTNVLDKFVCLKVSIFLSTIVPPCSTVLLLVLLIFEYNNIFWTCCHLKL